MSAIPLKGKIAIVTGSADGIGLGIARSLAAQGADIMLHGAAAEIGDIRDDIECRYGVRTRHTDADLSKAEAVRGLIEATAASLGRVDILVNNAGLQFTAPVERLPAEKWDAILALNLSAAFHGIAAALPLMKRQGWGRIVNIASTHGLVGSAYKAAYVAAKHGLVGLTKAVGLETAETGITVNAVCPGWVRTPLVERQIAELADQRRISREQAAMELLSDRQPSRSFVTPEQLGATVAFLCSPAADQITGTTIAVDGAWTAQ
jgi:3-hydroxybutyrate dehydrogenase